MCGRFRLARKKEILEEAFEVDAALDDQDWSAAIASAKQAAVPAPSLFADLAADAADPVADDGANGTGWSAAYIPRFNVAPGQDVLAVRQHAAKPIRLFSQLRWGLIPYWTNDPSAGYKSINARSETAATMRSFSEPLRLRRCLIPADGFYEWKRDGKQKLPFCFTLASESVFAFAGIWDRWRSPQGQVVESCSILTTAPNQLLQDIHDRMPVILAPDAYDLWLDPGFRNVAELKPLLQPYPAHAMRRYRVSQRVNHVKFDDAECAAAIDAA
jgi:putative SOS response-associated peptidase YedK